MKVLDKPEVINEYVRDVCAKVKAVEMHRDIREEIGNHVDELAEELMVESPGMDREEAIRAAVKQMGDPVDVGTRLNRIHRPKTDWSLVALLAAVLGIALLAMYSADQSLMLRSSGYPFHLFAKKAIYICIGVVFLLGLRLFDYRKLLNYTRIVYWVMIALMAITVMTGQQVNGASRYLEVFNFPIDVISLSPFVLVVTLCGILTRRDHGGKWWVQWAIYVLPPLFIYTLVPDVTIMTFFFIVAYSLFTLTYKSWMVRIVLPIVHFIGVLMMPTSYKSYLLKRLYDYLHPYEDPKGASYMVVQSLKTIREAGWFGHGIGRFNTSLPYIYSDMLYTYIIYSLGWIAGIVVAWVVAVFMIRIVNAAKIVSDPYGKQIILGLGALFGLKFIWSIAMSLGWLPIVSVQLPFFGFGGLGTIVDIAVIGFIMGVYRRKDMIRMPSRQGALV